MLNESDNSHTAINQPAPAIPSEKSNILLSWLAHFLDFTTKLFFPSLRRVAVQPTYESRKPVICRYRKRLCISKEDLRWILCLPHYFLDNLYKGRDSSSLPCSTFQKLRFGNPRPENIARSGRHEPAIPEF